MIIGNFTDLHARADTPEGRNDNFRESLLIKLEEIGQIWKRKGVELVTFTGDLFNSPDPASSVRNDILHILKSWDLPIIGVVGSHDYVGYQMKTLKRTALGSVYYSGIMQLVGGLDQPAFILFSEGKERVVVTGTPHTYWATDDPNYVTKPRFVKGVFQIQLIHFDLIHKRAPWNHLIIDQVKTESDIAFVGHYHPGWEQPILKDNCTFINQGSVARLEATERLPRVCIVETQADNKFTLEFIPLESALKYPFKEKENKVIEGVASQDVTRLLQMLETSEIEMFDVKALLPKVAKEFNYNEEVLIRAFELLEKV